MLDKSTVVIVCLLSVPLVQVLSSNHIFIYSKHKDCENVEHQSCDGFGISENPTVVIFLVVF